MIALDIIDLNEVIALLQKHHYSKISYHQLGLRLKLSHNTLEKIKKDHGGIDPCFTECLASWLRKADGVETPTIDTLIAALRGIGENAVADGINGERQNICIAVSKSKFSDRPALATPQMLPTSERHPPQPLLVNPGVRNLECRIDQIPNLRDIANELQNKFDYLVLALKKSLESNSIDVEDAKMLIHGCLRRKSTAVPELMPCIDILEGVNDFKSFFDFLSKHDFIGYLNYKLLKKLIELVKDDNEISRQFFEYEKEYAKLLSAASFEDLIPFFEQQSDLSPTAPLGLPYISFRLGSPWLHSRFYTWVSTFGEFSWSYYAILKQLRKNCVIITYAILPCVLDDVRRDLKDPLILKKLKDHDITVIELPQEEEDFDGKKEVIHATLSEENIPTTSTTLMAEVASIRKEAKSSSLGRELIKSIESHSKLEEFIGLLEAGADPNVTEYPPGGSPALIIAIEKDNTDFVKLLLEKGADPNVTEYTSGGSPALIIAIEIDNTDIVKLLLEKGADPNVTKYPSGGFPALIIAIEKGNTDIFKLLLEKGTDPNVTKYPSGGSPALIRAIEKDNTDNVKLLLEKGADPNATEYPSGSNPALIKAIKKNNIGIVEMLLEKGADPNIDFDTYYGTPLHCASQTGNANIIKLLITEGIADLNAVHEWSSTPLFNAVKSGSIEAVDILLTNGARTDVVDNHYGTPLHCASETGNAYIIKLLLTKGKADVNAVDTWNRTSLFKAVKSGSIEAVNILLTNGARTDVVSKYYGTPLHCASETGNANIIILLITKGNANIINAVDKDNCTPLFNAVKSGSIEAVDILLTNGARTDVVSKYEGTPLHCSARETGSANIIKLLITKGKADVNAVDKYSRTPLFYAVKSGIIEAVDILLTNGARTDVVSEYYGTPLHCASETGNANIIKLLITKGNADANAMDKDNKTPLFNAAKRFKIEAVDILLNNGARTDVVDEYGNTPLLLAVESDRSSQIIKLLIIKGQADVTAACEKVG
uniref:Death domain-containing protein n=1 Tax=Amphimedon queenslandica TaxID=400682 RepID=A0A1X7TMN8_AMPQE